MLFQYKEKAGTFNIDRCNFLENSKFGENIKIDFLFDRYPEVINKIMSLYEFPILIYDENNLSFDFINILMQLINSQVFSIDQKYTLIEIIDSIINNNFIEKNESILNIIIQFLLINEDANKLSKIIFKCLYDLICPNIIKIFPNNIYDIIKSSNDAIFICETAQKISENLTRKNIIAKEPFVSFLKEISELVNSDTALSIYEAHLHLLYVFPETFPILDFDFYAYVINFDCRTKCTILKMISQIKKGKEIFLNPQIQKIIIEGMINTESETNMIHSIRALTNFVLLDGLNFKEVYFSGPFSFQHLISHLNYLILELSFNVKSNASYLLSLLMSKYPQDLFQNIGGNSDICDIRKSILTIFDLDRPFLAIRLLYGLQSIALFSTTNNKFIQFYMKIDNYGILNIINDLTDHTDQQVAETALIVYTEISNKSRSLQESH